VADLVIMLQGTEHFQMGPLQKGGACIACARYLHKYQGGVRICDPVSGTSAVLHHRCYRDADFQIEQPRSAFQRVIRL